MNSVGRLLVLLISGLGLSVHAAELRWNPHTLQSLNYKAAADIDITGELGALNPATWLDNPSKFQEIIYKLKTLPLPKAYLHYRLHLQPIREGKAFRARMAGVPVKFDGKPANARERELQQRIQALTSAIMLQGDMDLSGDSAELTFYRSPKERNILTSFFYLPKQPVEVGDHWPLPVNLIETGPGIFVQQSAVHNQVTLTALKHTPQGTVAELCYLVSEKVEGYIERVANTRKGRPPFALNFTLFGYGEYLVDQGHWLRQVWVIDYTGKGRASVHKQNLFALELDH